MKTFITDIIPKIQRYSQKLDNLTLLTDQHWVLIDNIEHEKQVYLFRPNNELLISKNGKIERGKWEYLGNKSLLIDQGAQAHLFKHGFFDENLLALKIDSKEEYAFFVNENKYEGDLNSSTKVTEFLTNNYLTKDDKVEIEGQTGLKIISKERELTPDEIINEEQKRVKDDKEMATFIYVFFGLLLFVAIFVFVSMYFME